MGFIPGTKSHPLGLKERDLSEGREITMRFSWIHALFSTLLLINVVYAFSWPNFLTTLITHKRAVLPDLYEASVVELQVRQAYFCHVSVKRTHHRQAGLDAGHFTSVDLVKVRTYIHRLFDS